MNNMNKFIQKIILKFLRIIIEVCIILTIILRNLLRVTLGNLTILYLYVPYVLVAIVFSIIVLRVISIFITINGEEIIKILLNMIYPNLLGMGMCLIILNIICIIIYYVSLYCTVYLHGYVNERIQNIERY